MVQQTQDCSATTTSKSVYLYVVFGFPPLYAMNEQMQSDKVVFKGKGKALCRASSWCLEGWTLYPILKGIRYNFYFIVVFVCFIKEFFLLLNV